MGSSSTAGRDQGDVVPYPPRVQMYLRRKYANPRIDIVNRGKGGEEAIEELLRFDADIFGGSAVAGDLAGRHQRGVSQL